MCGRYSLSIEPDFFTRFQTSNTLDVRSHYNVSPSQTLPVVVQHSPNAVELMVWGFIPAWEAKKEQPQGLINLRDDTVVNKAWAHKYVQVQRCLVPATGFFEWQETAIGRKIPYYFYLKETKYFAFAGVRNRYTHPRSGKHVNTYAILTTTPNSLMEPIHRRMPVILAREDEDRWLNPDMVELQAIQGLLKPYPAEQMATYKVSPRVNYPKNDDPDILKPIP
jgi:putative SOS response-associated peptidase YedK